MQKEPLCRRPGERLVRRRWPHGDPNTQHTHAQTLSSVARRAAVRRGLARSHARTHTHTRPTLQKRRKTAVAKGGGVRVECQPGCCIRGLDPPSPPTMSVAQGQQGSREGEGRRGGGAQSRGRVGKERGPSVYNRRRQWRNVRLGEDHLLQNA